MLKVEDDGLNTRYVVYGIALLCSLPHMACFPLFNILGSTLFVR